ncbi:hypothetical protein M514_28097 [Trichuris suis]|uniref:Reverse transcriptase domain-containing protein n=1 Tax=Trichuris suis TaxID=68888 RepID=A0A085MR80_9BILA|nr:hypothetical protein M514_28097 [Trichuris suis]
MKMGIGIRFSRGGWRIDRPDWVSQTAAEGKDSQPTGDVERAPASKPHMNLEEMRHRKKGSHNMIAGTLAEDETTQATSLEQLRFGEQLFMEEKECLVKLTNSFEQLFNRLPAGKGNSYAVKHRIPTGGANPIVCRPYRVSVREREAINQQVEEMLQGVIEESHSPWAFPVVMVRKKDGNWRFCVDYRKLNAVMVRDVYPLPRTDEVLEQIRGFEIFLEARPSQWLLAVGGRGVRQTQNGVRDS